MTRNDPVGLVVGLREEAAPLRRALRDRQTVMRGSRRFDRGRLGDRPVVLVQSGAGRERARRASAALIEQFSIHTLLAVGYAGALVPDLPPATLLWADSVIEVPDAEQAFVRGWFPCLKCPSDDHRPRICLLATTGRVLGSADEKRALGAQLREMADDGVALAVDMETAGVAEAAEARRIPFAAIRVVTDGLESDLPLDFNRCMAPGGEFSNAALLAQAARHPVVLAGLVRLSRDSLRGARRLATFLADVLAYWP